MVMKSEDMFTRLDTICNYVGWRKKR